MMTRNKDETYMMPVPEWRSYWRPRPENSERPGLDLDLFSPVASLTLLVAAEPSKPSPLRLPRSRLEGGETEWPNAFLSISYPSWKIFIYIFTCRLSLSGSSQVASSRRLSVTFLLSRLGVSEFINFGFFVTQKDIKTVLWEWHSKCFFYNKIKRRKRRKKKGEKKK